MEWAVVQGLAPLAAYNLEYRFAGGNAPEWVRDRLLGIYQGLLNDNVMKLVNFKRSVDGLEGRRVVILGAATYAEGLYPHVAFRPVSEIRLFMRPDDVTAMAGFLKHAEFKPIASTEDKGVPAQAVVSDTRTTILLHGNLSHEKAEDEALLERAQPAKVFGPSMYRLSFEDALLVELQFLARAGFDVPMITWVDLRELTHVISDAKQVQQMAERWGLTRALYAAMRVLGRFFPDAEKALAALTPQLSAPVRAVLEASVVNPVAVIGRDRTTYVAEALRAVLTSS